MHALNHHLTRRPWRIGVLVVAIATVLAACGSSGSDATDSGKEPAKTTTTAPSTTDAAPAGEVATTPPVPSPGCGTSDVGSVVLEKTYLDDSDRWFLLTTPTDHDGETPIPLVLDFHGLMEGAEVHSKMSELSPYALDHGFALVVPHGQGTPIRWQITPDETANDDLQYTADLLDQVEAELCIDTSRVYATGLSNGAMMSSTLACTMSDRFAAVAPVAGVQRPGGCDPERPVPVLAIHGTDDPILLFNGGVGDRLTNIMENGVGTDVTATDLPEPDLRGEGYPTNIQNWAEGNGCTGEGTDEDLTDTVILRTWDCPPDAAAEFAIVQGGGHSWPGSEFSSKIAIMGKTDMSIEANDLIWSFFQRFALPQD